MSAENIKHLLLKYNAGETTPDDLMEIENLIELGKIELEELQGFEKLENQILKMETPHPSFGLDEKFYQMVRKEKESAKSFNWKRFFSWPEFAPQLVFASVTLILGLAVGYVLRSPVKKDEQIEQLGQEIRNLREMMMLSLLEKESATDRLKAVNLTHDMVHVSQKVTAALLQTLNNDENVNVRLAALDALRPYTTDSQIRESLIRSIAKQKSPLVQVALAELMAALQEKGAVKEFKNILEDQETPPDIKKKIRESIQVI